MSQRPGADLATRFTERAAGVLDRRLGRRSLLTKTALAGSALTVNPVTYLLKPVSAYAAICGCANQNCDCGSSCCDGYTEFCCTINGQNACPPGSVIAGWWKADGSGLCVRDGVDAPRYYMDCNARPAGPCGSKGVTGSTADCSCGCEGGNCNHRMACCTAFRYGQCNQQVACLGPIVCRVVTCLPPWTIEPTCTTTLATDNFTRTHDAPCLHNPPPPPNQVLGSLPLVVTKGAWYRGFTRADAPDRAVPPFVFGNPDDVAISGDWNGDGITSAGVVRGNTWYLRNTNTTGRADGAFTFGDPGDVPIVGDWVGDGKSRPGMVRGNTWFLRLSHTSGPADLTFTFGDPGDIPIVGDWDGDGRFGPGVVRGNRWYLRNSLTSGPGEISFDYGEPGDVPIVGDWNGDGTWTPGVIRGGTRWLLRNSNSAGPPDIELTFDLAGVDETRNARFLVWSVGRGKRPA